MPAASATSHHGAATARPAADDSRVNDVSATADRRRAEVEAALAPLVGRHPRRPPLPPEGRLGAGEDYAIRLRETLVELGPVFAAFGRYLSSRFDLLPRRTRAELNAIEDDGAIVPFAAVAALIEAELGAPVARLFFQFQPDPFAVGTWTQRHAAWLSPGVPATVTIVRPNAAADLQCDGPLLTLIAPALEFEPEALAPVVDDFLLTLHRRLDQKHQAASLAMLAGDARRDEGGFLAPACYRDHSASRILTVERIVGESVAQSAGGEELANRITTAWMKQMLRGSVVPYDFDERDLAIAGDRLVLMEAGFEPQAAGERERFAAYLNAVAADDPDAAARWIVEGLTPPPYELEVRLRRTLRQAVPFRDGEWSGDDRFAEHVLVQWRAAQAVGWSVSSHRQHVYRGVYSVAQIANRVAPDHDALLHALENERLRIGLEQAGRTIDPRLAAATLDRAIQELADLPQKLDDVLTLAAQGRLRMRVQVPEPDATEHTRNRTVLLVTALVAFAAIGAVLRHVLPALGGGVERIGAVLLLIVGGWLLTAAARL